MATILFFQPKEVTVLQLTLHEYEQLHALFSQLQQLVHQVSVHQKSIIALKLTILFYRIDELYRLKQPTEKTTHSRPEQLFDQFVALLSLHFKTERSLQFYAQQLFISPKYLSQIIVGQTGKKGSVLIREMIMLEAKVLLQDPALSVSEVSDILGFANASQFGKYFKKYAGISPGNYQKDDF